VTNRDEYGGAICRVAAPLRNACKKAERWQSCDNAFRASRFDVSGQLREKGRITVLQYRIMIHNSQEFSGITRAGLEDSDPTTPGPILLQGHGSAARHQNIWVIPAD
jgi:hypothetical protein